MRTLLTQDHPTNLRDLLINYQLDNDGGRIIDFTYGKGGFYKTSPVYPYKFKLTKCDAVPTEPDVIKKNLLTDDYVDLGMHDAGIFDPPYLYGHLVFDYSLNRKKSLVISAQKQGMKSWATNERFTENKNETVFIERVKALNNVALQCMKPKSLLFVKVMDVRNKGELVLNHMLIKEHLTNFKCYSIFVYFAGGAKTWKNHAEVAHGYWMCFKLVIDSKQTKL